MRGWATRSRLGSESPFAGARASNRQLAGAGITEQTAETHVKHILGKLELRSRHQVTEWVSHTNLAG
jgi:DNA-binding CsgD family transcriptional regulator